MHDIKSKRFRDDEYNLETRRVNDTKAGLLVLVLLGNRPRACKSVHAQTKTRLHETSCIALLINSHFLCAQNLDQTYNAGAVPTHLQLD